MTQRERTLAILLLPVLLVAGGAVFGYQFWYSPLRTKDVMISNLTEEIAARQEKVRQIKAGKERLEKLRQISPPADVVLAHREYADKIGKMLRAGGFDPNNFTIVPKPADSKSSPQLATKKPIYTRLTYTVTAKGELSNFVKFLEKF